MLDRSGVEQEIWEPSARVVAAEGPRTRDDSSKIHQSCLGIPPVNWVSSLSDISSPMITAASSRKHKTLRIHYVKLSAPAQYLAEWPADASKQHLGEMFHQDDKLINFLTKQKTKVCTTEDTIACQSPFPQYNTAHQVYSEERMRAYIQVGYYTIMNHLREATWMK